MAERLARIPQGQKENKGASLGHKAQLQPQRDKVCPMTTNLAGAASMAKNNNSPSPLFAPGISADSRAGYQTPSAEKKTNHREGLPDPEVLSTVW